MIVIAPDFSLVYDPTTANSPLIGWHNLVPSGTITATDEDTDYPVANLTNPLTYLEWRSTTDTGAEQLEFTVPGPYDGYIDYVAFARHTFGTPRRLILIEGKLAVGGYSTIAEVIPGDNSPLLVRFAPALYKYIRITLTALDTGVCRLAVLYVGRLLAVPSNLYVGHTPLHLGRETTVVTGRSTGGNFLGRVVLADKLRSSAQFQNLSPSWYRTNFDPFVRAAKTDPFFFAWRPAGYPNEVGLAWSTRDIIPSNQRPNGMMQVSLDYEGLAT